MSRQKLVSIKVPAEYAGLVAGALSFAFDVAMGWPRALADSEERQRYQDEICNVIGQLRQAHTKHADALAEKHRQQVRKGRKP